MRAVYPDLRVATLYKVYRLFESDGGALRCKVFTDYFPYLEV